MSNSFEDGVWILDTASTSALLKGLTCDIRVSRILWQPNAAADGLVLKDGVGDTKLSITALSGSPAGDEDKDFSGAPLLFKSGFVLHTLGGGTLYVYLA